MGMGIVYHTYEPCRKQDSKLALISSLPTSDESSKIVLFSLVQGKPSVCSFRSVYGVNKKFFIYIVLVR